MEKNGWVFDILHHEDKDFKSSCGSSDTWFGYSKSGIQSQDSGDGWLSAAFSGSGTVTLDYGNCHSNGNVSVYFNGIIQDIASSNSPSNEISLDYSPSDVLLLKETNEGIIKLNSLRLSCKGKLFVQLYCVCSMNFLKLFIFSQFYEHQFSNKHRMVFKSYFYPTGYFGIFRN